MRVVGRSNRLAPTVDDEGRFCVPRRHITVNRHSWPPYTYSYAYAESRFGCFEYVYVYVYVYEVEHVEALAMRARAVATPKGRW